MPFNSRCIVARVALALAIGAVVGACSRGAQAGASSPGADGVLDPPWAEAAMAIEAIPSIYRAVWGQAENRSRCALLVPARLDPALERTATPRAATFSGGWGVAYDLPDSRSAFGVAGTGASAWEPAVYDDWPEKRTFADGSRVGYGPEGGSGPNWLAYVRIPGQDCLYNVWSRRGRKHLEELLGQLRRTTSRADDG